MPTNPYCSTNNGISNACLPPRRGQVKAMKPSKVSSSLPAAPNMAGVGGCCPQGPCTLTLVRSGSEDLACIPSPIPVQLFFWSRQVIALSHTCSSVTAQAPWEATELPVFCVCFSSKKMELPLPTYKIKIKKGNCLIPGKTVFHVAPCTQNCSRSKSLHNSKPRQGRYSSSLYTCWMQVMLY